MIKAWGLAAATGLALAGTAQAADFKELRRLQAPPPVVLASLPADAKPRPVEFSRIIVHPRDGEGWAVVYTSSMQVQDPDHPRPVAPDELITWDAGRTIPDESGFARIFDEELKKAGFAGGTAESLFGDSTAGAADLKVGVLIDDLKGRFCRDCPNLFNPKGIPATVLMHARWEVYSSLDRKVIARIETQGGADTRTKGLQTVTPAIYSGFRENVRLLLASEEFRRVVTTSAGSTPTGAAAAGGAAPMALTFSASPAGVPQASKSVVVVHAADGMGSGFLISKDGYLLTNEHVVGGSKYVKLKWADGSETLGEVLRTDARRDVALIKADAKGRTPLALRRTAVVQGETVFAIGTPLEEALQNTMTRGIVSAAHRTYEGQAYIQSDVGVTHGNSGGPLLDEKGSVIGLTDLGLHADQSKSLNLFIPIEEALKALAVTPAG